jgi:hypothetical protein
MSEEDVTPMVECEPSLAAFARSQPDVLECSDTPDINRRWCRLPADDHDLHVVGKEKPDKKRHNHPILQGQNDDSSDDACEENGCCNNSASDELHHDRPSPCLGTEMRFAADVW